MPKQFYKPLKEEVKDVPERYITTGEQKGFILREGGKVKYQTAVFLFSLAEPLFFPHFWTLGESFINESGSR